MLAKLKRHFKQWNDTRSSDESGIEFTEFILLFPIVCFTVFTALDFGWALYQKITFDYALSAVSWDLDPISDERLSGMGTDGQAIVIKEYLAAASPDIIPDHLTVKAEGGQPIIRNATYTESKNTDQYDREVLGFGTKKYSHSYILIHCQYQYKIDWLLNFGDFFGATSWSYNTGIIDVARTTGKDFYFTS